jgi:hypothetical protein
VDLGPLDPPERAALEAEIDAETARSLAAHHDSQIALTGLFAVLVGCLLVLLAGGCRRNAG